MKASTEGKTASITRTITVAYEGVNLVVNIRGSSAWIKVWVDGKVVGAVSVEVRHVDGRGWRVHVAEDALEPARRTSCAKDAVIPTAARLVGEPVLA
jgi:hypothetical protein